MYQRGPSSVILLCSWETRAEGWFELVFRNALFQRCRYLRTSYLVFSYGQLTNRQSVPQITSEGIDGMAIHLSICLALCLSIHISFLQSRLSSWAHFSLFVITSIKAYSNQPQVQREQQLHTSYCKDESDKFGFQVSASCFLSSLSEQYFISAGPFATVSYFKKAMKLMRLIFFYFFGFLCLFDF